MKLASLRSKLLLSFLVIGLVPLLGLGILSMRQAGQALSVEAFNQLKSVRGIKAKAVTDYLQQVHNQALTLSEDRMIVEAMADLKRFFPLARSEAALTASDLQRFKQELGSYYQGEFSQAYAQHNRGQSPNAAALLKQLDSDSILLQHAYIRANRQPLGSKHLLDQAPEAWSYNRLHAEIHPVIRNFLEKFGYYDIFLVDSETGDIVYSVFKELDFTTSLLNGPYAQTNFGEAFRRANAAGDKDSVVMVDYAPYLPSYQAPAGFVASPIFEGGKKIGVLMFQFPIDRLNAIMNQRDGLGETGESYLVGSDLLMRSDSFLDPQHHAVATSFADPSHGKVDTLAVQAALSGQTDTQLIDDYNGNPVLSAYTPIKFDGLNWALLAEIDQAEAFAAIKALRLETALISLLATGGVLLLALLLARSIVGPIRLTMAMVEALEQGDLEHRIGITERRDELGQMARALNGFADNMRDEVLAAFEKLAAGDLTFVANGVIRQPLARTNAALNQVMGQIQLAAEQIASGSSQVAVASETLAQGATESAASLEEISSSMNQMAAQTQQNAENAGQAEALANHAKDAAEKGNSQMQAMIGAMDEINQAGQNINKIIKTIDEIAFQTNLLALNAAVEAARAGQAGKGFAVVAEEVRNLAARSAKAARETAELIESTVTKTERGTQIDGQTASALQEIVAGISRVTDLAAEIAAASNEQADGISQINQGLTQIDAVTQQNTSHAEETAATSEQLSGQAEALKNQLGLFVLHQTQVKTVARLIARQPAADRESIPSGLSWAEMS
jgi:methyl-accepting chemotaxis protein